MRYLSIVFYNLNVNSFMFLRLEYQQTLHTRPSKLGLDHTYSRQKTIVIFRCDNCSEVFARDKGQIDSKRLSNNYFHVCSNCDAKRFAQKRGKDRKKVWDLPASSLIDISHI